MKDRIVPDSGFEDARIIVVGEAPGEVEATQGRPFVGPSGKLLRSIMQAQGINPNAVYWTNVYPYRPKGNDISTVPADDLASYSEVLREKVRGMTAQVVVPLGNTALHALTGQSGITKWRGSLLEFEDKWVVPSVHPAAILRQVSWTKRAHVDWAKVYKVLSPAFLDPRPTYNTIVMPTAAMLSYALEQAAKAEVLAVDIETNPSVNELICVGFAWSGTEGISLTHTLNQGFIQKFLSLPNTKVFHNGYTFDIYYLARYGYTVGGEIEDTLAMSHALDPRDEHSLAFLQSVYTWHPYHKGMVRDQKEDGPGKVRAVLETLLEYNVIDCCVTWDLYHNLKQAMGEDTLNLYQTAYRPLIKPLMQMSLDGICFDPKAREGGYARLAEVTAKNLERLTELAGTPLHATKGLSTKKVGEYMYDTLKLPKPVRKGVKKAATDEATIRRLALRFPDKFGEAGKLLLDIRHDSQLAQFYAPERFESARNTGRFHFTFKFGTYTGRLSSSASPMGEGSNLQNISREAKSLFVPDPGHVFLNVDLSQAESRVVYMLSGDQALIDEARTPPWEYDHHTANAAAIFNIPIEAVTKEQRYIGKIVSHGAQRSMTGKKLQEVLLVNGGYFKTEKECNAMIEQYHATHPGIETYFRRVALTVIRDRRLVTPFGRVFDCTYDRLGPELYRQAQGFIPQSVVADIINQWGIIPLAHYLNEQRHLNARIVAQVHDSILVSVDPADAWEIWTFLKTHLEQPVTLDGQPLVIPAEASVGSNWSCSIEFKKQPIREEFEAGLAKAWEETQKEAS